MLRPTSLCRWLGVEADALEDRIARREVLACHTDTGGWLFPAFQFDANGHAIAGLPELIALLAGPDGDRGWRAARWLAAPAPYLPGHVPAAQWLRQGGDLDIVLRAARAHAAVWSA